MAELTTIYWGGAQVRGKTNQLGVANTFILDSTPDNLTTRRYSWRHHADEDGLPWCYTLLTGDPTLEAERHDYLLQQLIDGGFTGIDCVWYPTANLMALGAAGEQLSADIWRAGFDRYYASPLKSQLKFTLIAANSKMSHDGTIAVPSNTWGNFETYCDQFVTWFQDPQYLKVDSGKPVFYVYNVPAFPYFDSSKRAILDAKCTTAGIPTPLYVQQNHDMTDTLCQAVSSYGVVSGARPSGSGLKRYRDQYLKNRANWGPLTNFKTILDLCLCSNGEPRAVSVFCDRPMFFETVDAIQEALAFADANPTKVTNPPVIQVYSINEPDEGGPLARTPQDFEGVSPHLAATAAVMNDTIPEQAWHRYAARAAHTDVVRSGFTTYTRDIVGAFEGAESQSTTLGHTITISPSHPISEYSWRGTRGTGRGKANFYRDGVLVGAAVDLYAASNTRNAVLFSESGLTPDLYVLQIEVLAEKHIDSTGVTIGVDELRVLVDFSDGDPTPPVDDSTPAICDIMRPAPALFSIADAGAYASAAEVNIMRAAPALVTLAAIANLRANPTRPIRGTIALAAKPTGTLELQ